MQICAYRFETGWKYQTGIAAQSKLLHFLPRFPTRRLSRKTRVKRAFFFC